MLGVSMGDEAAARGKLPTKVDGELDARVGPQREPKANRRYHREYRHRRIRFVNRVEQPDCPVLVLGRELLEMSFV